MKAVIQRVLEASVQVDSQVVSRIGLGLLVLAAVQEDDTQTERQWMAQKLANLRIFEDDESRMNRSILDVSGQVLLVSNFTVAGDCRKGRRPSFDKAMRPPQAQLEIDALVKAVSELGVPVFTGVFGAHMHVELINDGPVTIVLESPT